MCKKDGSVLCLPDDLKRIGSTIRSYKITQLIGIGGMGVVYKGHHVLTRQSVAIKILRRRHSLDHRSSDEEMLREAHAASRICHPHIIHIKEFGTIGGSAYMIMEYLKGTSLSSRMMRERKISAKEAGQLVYQIADALGAAHRAGIIHRDLKPENVFLIKVQYEPETPTSTENESKSDEPLADFVKLLDFGLAKLVDLGPSIRTLSGRIAGTPYFMSPEQAKSQKVDGRSDIYSLGVLFYLMVTGTLPFMSDSPVDVLAAHINTKPVQPIRYCPDIGQGINQIIMCCLEKKINRRFQSMDELRIALENQGITYPPRHILERFKGKKNLYLESQPGHGRKVTQLLVNRRHKQLLVASSIMGLGMVVLLIVLFFLLLR